MPPRTAAELLDAWERALSDLSPRRALRLLAAACPGESDDDLAG